MLQFSYLPNGDLQITTDTADGLLNELFNQYSQKMVYSPRSYVARNIYSNCFRIAVAHAATTPKKLNTNCDIYEISPLRRKIISRDAESFFAVLSQACDEGFSYSAGSANLNFGSYSAVIEKIQAVPVNDPAPVTDPIPEFDLSVALALQTKEEVIAYCEKFGIKVDARKTLPKIQNWLQAQSS